MSFRVWPADIPNRRYTWPSSSWSRFKTTSALVLNAILSPPSSILHHDNVSLARLVLIEKFTFLSDDTFHHGRTGFLLFHGFRPAVWCCNDCILALTGENIVTMYNTNRCYCFWPSAAFDRSQSPIDIGLNDSTAMCYCPGYGITTYRTPPLSTIPYRDSVIREDSPDWKWTFLSDDTSHRFAPVSSFYMTSD